MRNTHAASDLYIPDPDIGGLAISIRSLYVAILTRAIKDIFKPTYSDHEIYRTQALYWIATNDSESITSFINICNHLDIDVDDIRHIINVELNRIERGLPHRIKFSMGDYNMRTGRDN
jgi:predicted pyridoxine 5'-phosphate oxidase superfamily flavin-nucleotide-binding protein